ncbi:MAG: hypothetical protein IT303_19870 [Dehalococcoidia bacterium]|nr:hypothetical protein [Dehalococcoidia bacterium]
MHVELTPEAQHIIEAAIERGEFATPEQLVDSVLTAWAGVPCDDAGDEPGTAQRQVVAAFNEDGQLELRYLDEVIAEALADGDDEYEDWTPELAARLLEESRQAAQRR